MKRVCGYVKGYACYYGDSTSSMKNLISFEILTYYNSTRYKRDSEIWHKSIRFTDHPSKISNKFITVTETGRRPS